MKIHSICLELHGSPFGAANFPRALINNTYYTYIYMCIYIYIPGTQMTLVLVGKGQCFGGLTFKNSGHLGSR